mmetsp:Transcript_25457/g.58701  ORF Transcript_25457/g.58701 Transcript_25457/m.58701 type:complete len:294 (-) Transcript_25457:1963-2844(-)
MITRGDVQTGPVERALRGRRRRCARTPSCPSVLPPPVRAQRSKQRCPRWLQSVHGARGWLPSRRPLFGWHSKHQCLGSGVSTGCRLGGLGGGNCGGGVGCSDGGGAARGRRGRSPGCRSRHRGEGSAPCLGHPGARRLRRRVGRPKLLLADGQGPREEGAGERELRLLVVQRAQVDQNWGEVEVGGSKVRLAQRKRTLVVGQGVLQLAVLLEQQRHVVQDRRCLLLGCCHHRLRLLLRLAACDFDRQKLLPEPVQLCPRLLQLLVRLGLLLLKRFPELVSACFLSLHGSATLL